MYVVDFPVGRYEYDSREFETQEEAEAFAAQQHEASIYRRIEEPSDMDSRWSFEKIK